MAVLGATGAVGREMVRALERHAFPVASLRLLASPRSAGTLLPFSGEQLRVEAVHEHSFDGVDLALFSAGGGASRQWAPVAIHAGCVVIDNSSAFRMEPDVPLIVPEVNGTDLVHHHGLIANPNCSTAQLVLALEPLKQHFGLRRVIVSTYQAVSGSGQRAIDELERQLGAWVRGESVAPEVLPVADAAVHYPIALNVLPQIDHFLADGFTKEEEKMQNETQKILHAPRLAVSATCVRVPVVRGHSESVYVELEEPAELPEIRNVLRSFPTVVVEDDPEEQRYPYPLMCAGREETFVGRLRRDRYEERGIHFWIVSDNLLRGAASNAVMIAEAWAKGVHG